MHCLFLKIRLYFLGSQPSEFSPMPLHPCSFARGQNSKERFLGPVSHPSWAGGVSAPSLLSPGPRLLVPHWGPWQERAVEEEVVTHPLALKASTQNTSLGISVAK